MASDLNTRFIAYLISLKAASPTAKDVTTLLAKDLPGVQAAHPLANEVDDYNTLMAIHLGVTFDSLGGGVGGQQLMFDPGAFDTVPFDTV